TMDCDDGNACTSDACADGTCTTEDVTCDDEIACTVDTCDPDTGCDFAPDDAACDDGNPCTTDTCSADVGCVYTANNEACDDDNPCTSEGECNGGGFCVPAEEIDCVHLDGPCTIGGCDSETGGCIALPVSDGNACGGDDLCVTSAACVNGSCETILESVCDDGNACTVDACDPLIGCFYDEPPDKPEVCPGEGVCANAPPVCVEGAYECSFEHVPAYSPVDQCDNDLDDNCDGFTDEDGPIGCVNLAGDDCIVGTLKAVYPGESDKEMKACGVDDGLLWTGDICPGGWHVCDYTAYHGHLDANYEQPRFDQYWLAARIHYDADTEVFTPVNSETGACGESDACQQTFSVQAVTLASPTDGPVEFADAAWGCNAGENTGSCESTTAAGVMCCRACLDDTGCGDDDGDPCTTEHCDLASGHCVQTQLVPEEP
ncbi:MAG: hypothetical protein QF464_20310, partial [Myxococcota bacterium]|nr:hypothetical protein [Myxococcota bacterium]